MSDTGWKYDETKSEAENWDDYQALVAELEQVKADSYAEAGTLTPAEAVTQAGPDSSHPVANLASRDNIVLSEASSHETQAALAPEPEPDEDVADVLPATDDYAEDEV